MSFWSGQTLAAKLPNIIPSFRLENIDCAAYTLAMGPEFYVTSGKFESDPHSGVAKQLADGEHFKIPSGQFAFLLTEETINMPDNALAFISMKSKYKWRGLINVSGFHVDPGYKGRLIFAVYNAGPSELHVKRGDQIFLIWFCDLDEQSEERYKKSYDDKYRPLASIPSHLAATVSGHIYSPMTLIEDTRKNRENLNTINWLGRIFSGMIIALLVGALSYFEYRVARLEDQLMSVSMRNLPPNSAEVIAPPVKEEKASPVTNQTDGKEDSRK